MFRCPFLTLFLLLSAFHSATPVTIHLHKRKVLSVFPELRFRPGGILQTCANVPPGSCCRLVTPPGTSRSFPVRHPYAATFAGLEPLDIAAIWAPSKAPGQTANGRIVNGGCTGRITATHRGSGRNGMWTFEGDMLSAAANWGQEVVELLGAQVGLLVDRMEGASYVRLSQCPGSNFSNAQGLRAFLGGGGQMFAPTDGGSGASITQGVDDQHPVNARDITHRDCHMQQRDLDKRDGQSWMWPSYITIGGATYTQKGGEQSLIYEDVYEGILDLETL